MTGLTPIDIPVRPQGDITFLSTLHNLRGVGSDPDAARFSSSPLELADMRVRNAERAFDDACTELRVALMAHLKLLRLPDATGDPEPRTVARVASPAGVKTLSPAGGKPFRSVPLGG